MSHNIEWHAVVSLLEAVGTVTTHHDHKVEVTVGDGQAFVEPQAGKDIDPQTVVDLRHLLAEAATSPADLVSGGYGSSRGSERGWGLPVCSRPAGW